MSDKLRVLDDDRLNQMLHQVSSKRANQFSTRDLEELQAHVNQRQRGGHDSLKEAGQTITRILKRRYRLLSKHPEREVLSIDQAEDAALPVVPRISTEGRKSVGDVNLLTQTVPTVKEPFAHVVMELARQLIQRTGGVIPNFGIHYVVAGATQVPRIVVQWCVKRALTVEELHAVYQLSRRAYGNEVLGYRESGTSWQEVAVYRNFRDKAGVRGSKGIYFGPNNYYAASAQGVFVYRKFKDASEANYLLQNHPLDFLGHTTRDKDVTTLVEFRDSGKSKDSDGLAQDMFLMLVVQISYLLAKGRLIDGPTLMAAIFRELNRVGTRNIRRDMLYGMSEILEVIDRCLLLPLQRPDLATFYGFMPESVLLAGVPGIGKTFLEHYLMTGEYGAIFAAVDTERLRSDLEKSAEDGASAIMLRIDQITELSCLPVVLIIDDIDVILQASEIISKFLNMMQGIRQKGLHVLASTNYPERIDPRLLEPGRLSKIVHVGLPTENDRAGVLRNYLRELPFDSDRVREAVLHQEVAATKGWTQRYLWQLTIEASRLRAMRVQQGETNRNLALIDFEEARAHLERTINFRKLQKWNRRIAQHVSRVEMKIGF